MSTTIIQNTAANISANECDRLLAAMKAAGRPASIWATARIFSCGPPSAVAGLLQILQTQGLVKRIDRLGADGFPDVCYATPN